MTAFGRSDPKPRSNHEKKPFSFPELLKESATAMHRSGNQAGLEALVQAMPASKAFVDTLCTTNPREESVIMDGLGIE